MLQDIHYFADKIKTNISKVFIGKDKTIDLFLTAFFSSGHVLLEDIPGVGKTLLAKAFARSVGCSFKRIQFTPDLLPTDLTGLYYYNQKECEFIFRKGPIFSNIILADEINRATPRTQSGLLECMEEHQVTVEGNTEQLANPFWVIATQNPIENQGTFLLPEAQMDRFLMRINIGYPPRLAERQILDVVRYGLPLDKVESIIGAREILDIQRAIMDVKIKGEIKDYILDIVEETRKHKKILLGASPRGSIALMRASQAFAAINGRDYVIPDDVKELAVPVLGHRIIFKDIGAIASTAEIESEFKKIVECVKVPIETFGGIGNFGG